jgi:hypothetical protein
VQSEEYRERLTRLGALCSLVKSTKSLPVNTLAAFVSEGIVMTFWYVPENVPGDANDRFLIANGKTRSILGYARGQAGKYLVEDNDDREIIAVVNGLKNAGPALAAYYEKHAKWEHDEQEGQFSRWTQYGVLVVAQRQGLWYVERDADPLVRDGEVAIFHTRKEAQRAAEAHRSRASIGPEGMSTGYYWFEPFQKSWYSDHIAYAKWRAVVDA